ASGLPIEVAHSVLCEVARRYLPTPRHAPLLRSHPSPHALALYRQARLEHERSVPYARAEPADALFEQAVHEEPRFAEAWSGLADLWADRMLAGGDRASAARRTRELAQRALALQPDNAEALSALGGVAARYDYVLPAAEAVSRRAVAADPEYAAAHFNLAVVLTARGAFDEAFASFNTARQLDPVMFDHSALEPLFYFYARRYEDAAAGFFDLFPVSPKNG